MIRNVKRFFTLPNCSAQSTRARRLSPEEDVLILGDENDVIDETLPSDLWFRSRSPMTRNRTSRIIG